MDNLILLVLHKLEDSFGYYEVETEQNLKNIETNPFPHEICLHPDGSKIYIAEMGVRGIESEGAGGHTVSVFDTVTGKKTSTIDTGQYDRPHGVAAYENKLYVTSESTKHLLIYDLDTEELIKAVYLDQECAHMVSVTPDGRAAYTANIWSNTITAVDTVNYRVLHHIPVPERPEGMVFSPDGSLIYCVCREAYAVAVIDREQARMVDTIETGNGPVRIVITPDGSRLGIPLFHSSRVEVADTRTRKVIRSISIGPHPAGTCLSPDGRFLFVSCEEENMVYVLDMESMEIIQKIQTGNGADAMVCIKNQNK